MILEKNIIQKNPLKTKIRIGLTYPNIYKTAMSSLGFQLLYNLINERDDSWCERIIYPEIRSIESNSPLKDFDIISFSIQYEQDYFNVLEMLKLSEIPLKREDRKENHPLIIAGGPCTSSNPLPLSDYIDLFIIGDGEIVTNELLDLYENLDNPRENIGEFSKIKGIYVSELNNPTKICINNMDSIYHNVYPLIVETENKDYLPVFNNSIFLNVSRGCTRGCRFCMSSFMYRPLRETNLEKLFEIAEKSRENSGFNKVNLIGTAVGDYSKLDELINGLKERNFEVSTPSLRMESLNLETLSALKESGLKTLTIAPESIYTLRKDINKDISDKLIETVIKDALNLNLKLKLYFLIGLPNENEKSIKELANYIKYLNDLDIKKNSISFSINPTIPKANTPLQWDQYHLNSIKKKIKYLKKELKNINIKFESGKMGLIQYVLSCGGKEVGKLVAKSLDEKVLIKEWEKYIPNYNYNSTLPWHNINIGLKSNFLKEERKKISLSETTPWCGANKCYNCGSCENNKKRL